jgi:hypothetical protein
VAGFPPSPFGFNIGYGFGDTSAASENMIFFEGRGHKIGRLSIALDEKDALKPWRQSPRLGASTWSSSPISIAHRQRISSSWSRTSIKS